MVANEKWITARASRLEGVRVGPAFPPSSVTSGSVRVNASDRSLVTRAKKGAPGRPRWVAYCYIAPALVFFAAFVIWPVASTVNTSFYAWDGITQSTWVGVDNYLQVFSNEALRNSFAHSLVFVIFYCVLPVILGLIVAAIMGRSRLKGLPAFRLILFLPQVVAAVVSGLAWNWMYATDGAVNVILRAIGLGDVTRAWLGDYSWALPAIGVIGTWTMLGLTMILFVSGIQKIDPSLYEAARMDGTNALQEFFAVTLPGLRGEVTVALTVTMLAALKSFDLVFVTTSGGPGVSTTVPAISVYQLAFSQGQVGLASSIAVILALILALVVIAINRFVRKPE